MSAYRQHYTPALAQRQTKQRAPLPSSMARRAVFAALLLGACTVGAVLAGVLP